MSRETLNEDLNFLKINRSFLGREFLTWLWFKSETQNHKIKVTQLGEFQFFIDDRIVLCSASGSVRENSLKGGSPGYAQEASAALIAGKMLQEAKFVLQNQQSHWSFCLCADDLSLKNIRLPAVGQGDSQEHILGRLELAGTLNEIIEQLYKEYMDLRMSSDFTKEAALIQQWLEEKISSY